MGTEGPFSEEKRGRGVTLTTHHHLVPRSWMSRSYTSSPPSASMACTGTALFLLFRNLIRNTDGDSDLRHYNLVLQLYVTEETHAGDQEVTRRNM
jgi:hypothetical protein